MSKHEDFIARSVAEMHAKREAHNALWKLLDAAWSVDQDAGTIVFTTPHGVTATCPVQIIGTYDTQDGTWLWGWDHPSVVPALAEHAKQTLAYGKKNRLKRITTRKLECDENEAWEFMAIACKVNDAQGAYLGDAGRAHIYMTFGEPKLTGKPKAKPSKKKPTGKKAPAAKNAKAAATTANSKAQTGKNGTTEKPTTKETTSSPDEAGQSRKADLKLLANPSDAVRAFIQMSCDWETKANELSEAADAISSSDEDTNYKLQAKNDKLIAKGYESLVSRFCVAKVSRKWQSMSFPPTHDPARETVAAESIKGLQATVRTKGKDVFGATREFEYRLKKFGDVWRLWSIRERDRDGEKYERL